MNCWVCDLPANGICRFCGRAVCKEHARAMPYILESFLRGGSLQGLVVADVVHCGVCQPRPDPVPLDFLQQ